MTAVQTSLQIRYIQEYLCLLGIAVQTDGEYGPATAAAIREWCDKTGASLSTDPLDGPTGLAVAAVAVMRAHTGLTAAENPDRNLEAMEPGGANNFGATAANLARFHASLKPKEVGKDNYGPWVRLYMGGEEGLPWCGGFVSTIWRQAATLAGVGVPIAGSWSCTTLASQASQAGLFRRGEALGSIKIPAGSLFLRRKKDSLGQVILGSWEHTGVVVEDNFSANIIKTIEGNTNSNGSREGFEVCQHILRRDSRDYIFPS